MKPTTFSVLLIAFTGCAAEKPVDVQGLREAAKIGDSSKQIPGVHDPDVIGQQPARGSDPVVPGLPDDPIRMDGKK